MNFDSLIIGNSYTENTSCKEAADVFGGSFINTSMSGATLYEISVVLDYALRHKKIKTVFGILSENSDRKGHGVYPLSEWTFLYDDNPFNDFKAYLNARDMNCLADLLLSGERCAGRVVDMDRPNAWFDKPDHASYFGGLDGWIAHDEYLPVRNALYVVLPRTVNEPLEVLDGRVSRRTASAIRDALDECIVRPAKKYPDTNFIYFFNPEMLLSRAFAARDDALNKHLFWVREAVALCADLDNVHLYFFANEPFTEDAAYYMDLGHYSADINSLILQAAASGKNRLTPADVEEQLGRLVERASAYDIQAINDYVQKSSQRAAEKQDAGGRLPESGAHE